MFGSLWTHQGDWTRPPLCALSLALMGGQASDGGSEGMDERGTAFTAE